MKKSFKKAVIAVTVSAMMMAGVVGCGKDADAEVSSLNDLADITRYVTSVDYSNLTVDLFDDYSVDDATAKMYADYYFATYAGYATTENLIVDPERAVEDGDMVNIDYAGYRDGEQFQGGTSEGAFLWIGSDSFIDGFEDGLVGVLIGETVDLNLTFPEDYGNDLAGAEVVFTVTVNGIYPEQDAYNSWALLQGYSGTVSSYDDIIGYYRDTLSRNMQENYETDLEDAVITELMSRVTFGDEFPAPLILAYQTTARDLIDSYASMYGMDSDTFAAYYLGTTVADYVQTYSYNQLQLDAAFQYIAVKEGLTLTDEQLQERLYAYLTELGSVDPAADAATLELDTYRMYFLEEDVMAYLIANTTVRGQQ